MIAWTLALALAFGQEEPPPPETPPVEHPEDTVEDGVLVVRVFGPDAIREARRKVIEGMEAQGWRAVRSNKGEVVFRGPANWLGAALLDDQGTMSFTTPAVAFQEVSVDDGTLGRDSPSGTPLAQESPGGDFQAVARDPGEEIVPQASFALFPKKKADAVHDQVLMTVGPELSALRDAIQETAFQEQLQGLSDRLDATWELGTPIEPGGPRLATIEERRRAVLVYWATRSDTPQGEDTCRTIELWLSRVVQPSSDPVTPQEQEEANASAQHSRRLALVKP